MMVYAELTMTIDISDTTTMDLAATHGNIDLMNYLFYIPSILASIERINGKTVLLSI